MLAGLRGRPYPVGSISRLKRILHPSLCVRQLRRYLRARRAGQDRGGRGVFAVRNKGSVTRWRRWPWSCKSPQGRRGRIHRWPIFERDGTDHANEYGPDSLVLGGESGSKAHPMLHRLGVGGPKPMRSVSGPTAPGAAASPGKIGFCNGLHMGADHDVAGDVSEHVALRGIAVDRAIGGGMDDFVYQAVAVRIGVSADQAIGQPVRVQDRDAVTGSLELAKKHREALALVLGGLVVENRGGLVP